MPFSSKDSIQLGMGGGAASTGSNISQVFLYSNAEIACLTRWIVSMISTGPNRNLCMEYIKKLFSALRSFYYPSNTGSWSVSFCSKIQYLFIRILYLSSETNMSLLFKSNLFLFLKSMPDALIKRIRS